MKNEPIRPGELEATYNDAVSLAPGLWFSPSTKALLLHPEELWSHCTVDLSVFDVEHLAQIVGATVTNLLPNLAWESIIVRSTLGQANHRESGQSAPGAGPLDDTPVAAERPSPAGDGLRGPWIQGKDGEA